MAKKHQILQEPEKVAKIIDGYFGCRYNPNPHSKQPWSKVPLFTGLAHDLGLDLKTMFQVADGEHDACDDDVAEAINHACVLIEAYHEQRLAEEPKTCIGSIFVLKQRKKHWRDQQQVEHSGEISSVTRTQLPPKAAPGEPISRPSNQKRRDKNA